MEGRSTLTPLELAVLTTLVAGEGESLRCLQIQADQLVVRERQLTGVGFFTNFALPYDAPALPSKADTEMSDVYAERVSGLDAGAGFVLRIAGGRIESLEGFSYSGPWPDPLSARDFSLRYLGSSEERNLADVKSKLD